MKQLFASIKNFLATRPAFAIFIASFIKADCGENAITKNTLGIR